MEHVSHWEEAETETADLGVIGGTWTSGAEGLGARSVGVNRIQVPAGKAATPQHAEDEEVFYVLDGSGWSVQEDGCFAIGAGDVVFYSAWRPAHTVVAGDDGLDVIAFGTMHEPRPVRFPRLDAVKVSGHLLSGDQTHQWEVEARLPRIEVKDPPDPRPETIVNIADIESFEFRGTKGRFLTRGFGASTLSLNHAEHSPGAEGAPLHCHSAEEEFFIVIEGDGVLLLGVEEAEHPVRTGSIVLRPAGTGEAHAFRGGEQGMSMLMFSDRRPDDMAYYPRTGKVTLRGLGVTFKPEIVSWAD